MNSKTKETLRGKRVKSLLFISTKKRIFHSRAQYFGLAHTTTALSFLFFSLSPPSKAEDRTQGLVLARQPLYH